LLGLLVPLLDDCTSSLLPCLSLSTVVLREDLREKSLNGIFKGVGAEQSPA
jgi:hypothetical protein